MSAPSDPFTMSARLCDDDGVVRCGAMHHGEDYACTSHAHFAGEHIRCTSPAHEHREPVQYGFCLGPAKAGPHTPWDAMEERVLREAREAEAAGYLKIAGPIVRTRNAGLPYVYVPVEPVQMDGGTS